MSFLESFARANNIRYQIKASKNYPAVLESTHGGIVHPDNMLLTYEEVYKSYSTVFTCVDLIAKSIAGLPYRIYRVNKAKDGTIEKEDISDDDRFEAIYKPSGMNENGLPYTQYDMWYELLTHYLVAGEMFAEIVMSKMLNRVLELHVHRPSRMRIKANKDGIVKFVEDINSREIDYDPEQMLYIRSINSFNDFRGLSPLMFLQLEIATGLNALRFGNNFFVNGAKVSGIYRTDETMSDSAFDRFKKQMRDEYSGVENSYSIMILEGEGEYKPTGMTMVEMEYIKQIDNVDQRIGGLYGVPKIFLNSTESQAHANVQDQRKILWETTNIPHKHKLESTWNMFMLPRFTGGETDIIGEWDISGVEALKEDRNKQEERARKSRLAGGITGNEYRQSIGFGLSDNPMMDKFIVPSGHMLLDDIAVSTAETPEPEKESLPKKSLTGRVENKQGFEYEDKAMKNEMLKKLLIHTKRTAIWRDGNRVRLAFEKEYIRASRKIFEAQNKEALRLLRKAEKKDIEEKVLEKYPHLITRIEILKQVTKSIDSAEFKQEASGINVDAVSLNLEVAQKQFLKAFRPIQGKQVVAAVARIAAMLSIEIENITVSHPGIKKVLASRNDLIKGITRTTNDIIHRQLEKGIAGGESIGQLASRVNDVFDAASKSRSQLIARTETSAVSNGSQLVTMKDVGVKTKMWLTERDDRVSEEDARIDGETVKIDKNFSNGLPSPPSRPNCRCDLIPGGIAA